MFRFQDPQYLYLLLLVPVLAVIRLWMMHKRKTQLRKMGDPALLRLMMPDVSAWRPLVKFCLLEMALALLAVMLARPQLGTKISKEKRTGIETVIAMDVSNSMRATDVEPSRLERSKMMVERMVDRFRDDKIALIIFAGEAFVQLPITSDYVSAKMFLGSIDPSMIATQGTDMARAISMASESFTKEEGVGKAIVIITDGEDHEGGAVEAAQAAKKKGMRVYVLGVGSTAGAPVPVRDGANDFIRDNQGNTVMSRLNEDMCRQIAQAGGGAYIHVENNSNAQKQLEDELDKLAHKETEAEIYSGYDEQFQAFGLIILLLIVLEVVLLESKNPLAKRFTFFGNGRKKAPLVALLCMCAAAQGFAQDDRTFIKEGNKAFRQGNYASAETDYRKAVEKNPQNPQALYNLGNALLAQNKDSAAVEMFEKAVRVEKAPLRKAMAYHNIGVTCQKNRLYKEAVEAYKSSLRLNPHDDETRYNLALCKRLQKQQEDKQQQNQQQQNQDKKDDQQKQDKQDQQQQDQKQDQQKQDQQKQQEKNQMDRQNAEQMLKAAIQQEKETQKKLKEAERQNSRRQLEKQW